MDAFVLANFGYSINHNLQNSGISSKSDIASSKLSKELSKNIFPRLSNA